MIHGPHENEPHIPVPEEHHIILVGGDSHLVVGGAGLVVEWGLLGVGAGQGLWVGEREDNEEGGEEEEGGGCEGWHMMLRKCCIRLGEVWLLLG